MSRIEVNGHPIDETSQIILQILRDRGGEAPTTTLSEQIDDVERDEQIRYRLRNHLTHDDVGFVERAGKESREGGTEDVQIWRLSDDARDWLDDHVEDITDAVDAASAQESLVRTRQYLDNVSDRMDDFENRVENVDSTGQELAGRLGEIQRQLDNVEDGLTDLEQQLESRNKDIDRRLDAIEEAVESNATSDEIDELEATMTGRLRDVINHLNDQSDNLSAQMDDVVGTVQRVDKTTREILSKSETSLISRLKWWQ